VFSLPTACPSTATSPGAPISAATPEDLASGQLTVSYTTATPETLVSPTGALDPNGPATDPVGRALPPLPVPGSGGCATSPGPALGGYTAISDPLPTALTYVGLGKVDVPYTFSGVTGQLDARVWDVDPGGATLLVSRGVYRLDVPGFDASHGTLHLPLFGNHWALAAGHRIRLDLTQVDQPFLRPSNPPSSITFSNPQLVLPTQQSGAQTLAGQ
jgi:hypothetical protein